VYSFKQWLEDTGQVWAKTNDGPYEEKGIPSKYTATDWRSARKREKDCTKCKHNKSPDKVFGFMKKMKK